MTDAWESAATVDKGKTYHDWGQNTKAEAPIDFIFYDGFSACESMLRVTQEYKGCPYVSDHYPVTAVLDY